MSHVSPSHKNKFLTMWVAILLFLLRGEGNIYRRSRTSIKQPQRKRKMKIFRLAVMKSGLTLLRVRSENKKKECIGKVCVHYYYYLYLYVIIFM
jgi:hypothetical protein